MADALIEEQDEGTVVLLAAAPTGRGRLVDATAVSQAFAAVPPAALAGTRVATVVELVDPVDPQAVLTRLRAAADGAGRLTVYLAGQLHVDQRQHLPHLALARTSASTLRYTALPWHWLADTVKERRPGTTRVVADLVADAGTWRALQETPALLELPSGTTLYGRVVPPPGRRAGRATPEYLRAYATIWRGGDRPPLASLHAQAAARAAADPAVWLAREAEPPAGPRPGYVRPAGGEAWTPRRTEPRPAEADPFPLPRSLAHPAEPAPAVAAEASARPGPLAEAPTPMTPPHSVAPPTGQAHREVPHPTPEPVTASPVLAAPAATPEAHPRAEGDVPEPQPQVARESLPSAEVPEVRPSAEGDVPQSRPQVARESLPSAEVPEVRPSAESGTAHPQPDLVAPLTAPEPQAPAEVPEVRPSADSDVPQPRPQAAREPLPSAEVPEVRPSTESDVAQSQPQAAREPLPSAEVPEVRPSAESDVPQPRPQAAREPLPSAEVPEVRPSAESDVAQSRPQAAQEPLPSADVPDTGQSLVAAMPAPGPRRQLADGDDSAPAPAAGLAGVGQPTGAGVPVAGPRTRPLNPPTAPSAADLPEGGQPADGEGSAAARLSGVGQAAEAAPRPQPVVPSAVPDLPPSGERQKVDGDVSATVDPPVVPESASSPDGSDPGQPDVVVVPVPELRPRPVNPPVADGSASSADLTDGEAAAPQLPPQPVAPPGIPEPSLTAGVPDAAESTGATPPAPELRPRPVTPPPVPDSPPSAGAAGGRQSAEGDLPGPHPRPRPVTPPPVPGSPPSVEAPGDGQSVGGDLPGPQSRPRAVTPPAVPAGLTDTRRPADVAAPDARPRPVDAAGGGEVPPAPDVPRRAVGAPASAQVPGTRGAWGKVRAVARAWRGGREDEAADGPAAPALAAPGQGDPHPGILAAAQAGRHSEAAAAAAAWELDALRRHGAGSGAAIHWLEVRADLARLADEPARSCELWIAAARARIGQWQDLGHPDVEGAVDRAHHQWEQVSDEARARALAPELIELRRQVPGRRAGALQAIRRRLDRFPREDPA
ncbi:hypothetical protein [Streptomyces tritici]|uniref:hypothetical protein n=1 Tax=Streptomyces tritici TaxID=2054410 RepID=UPI003AF00A51